MPGPELQTLLALLRENPPIQGDDLLAMRAYMAATAGLVPAPEDVDYSPVDAGGVPAEWTAAHGARGDRAVLYAHGGGYALGSIATHRVLVAGIARASGARVLSLDYRLAPEHVCPAAIEDGVAAYRFLLAQGIAPERIAIAGDSAGGGFTVATLVALRDAGEPLPGAGVCISPWLDLSQTCGSMTTKADVDPVVDKSTLDMMASAYLGGADAKTPSASPLFADLAGLPPILVQVGTSEILLDDSRSFTKRAREAGVDVQLEEWEEMVHVWHAFAAILPEAQQAVNRIGEYLREKLG